MNEWIAFIDFDGTITSRDTFSAALIQMNPPGLQEVYDKMLSEEITLSQGVNELYGRVPSSKLPMIEAFIKTVPLRAGFADFLKYMQGKGVPVVVVSGGLYVMTDIALAPYTQYITAVHAVGLDTSGETMRLVSEHDDGVEVMKKTAILAQYEYRNALVVGDSYTDFRMAMSGDAVFARDELAEFLSQQNLPFYPWNDFHDIVKTLEERKLFDARGSRLAHE